jgi:hypothetical protein
MRDSSEHPFPEDLDPVEAALRAHRASAEPLELDRLKRRVLTRHIARRGRWAGMRSRIAAVLTVIGLVAGSGGALAVAGGSSGGSAARAQYGCKKDKDHGKCEKHAKRKDRHCDDKSKKDRDKHKCEARPHKKDKKGDK